MIHIQKEKNLKISPARSLSEQGHLGQLVIRLTPVLPVVIQKKKKKKLAKTKIWSQPRKYRRIQEGHVREQKDLKSLHLCNEKKIWWEGESKVKRLPERAHEKLPRGSGEASGVLGIRIQEKRNEFPRSMTHRVCGLSQNLKVCFVFLLDSKCVPADGQKHCLATGLPACSFQF